MTQNFQNDRRKPILIVQHAPHEHPAALRRALESQGLGTHWIHPYRNETYPQASEIGGVISLGGPMGANDEGEYSWITDEIDLLKASVDAQIPVVGICLGGQMLARALGGSVERHEGAEVGWFPILLSPDGEIDPVLRAAGTTPTVYHWHNDTFRLPPGATLLASSKACARQAFRYGENVYGFQFHPEADHQLVLEWLALEGIEDDIKAVKREFGAKSVQAAKTQRNYALKGEKGSLKITAAIGSLFRRRAVEPIRINLSEELESHFTHRKLLQIEFEGSHRKPVNLRGKVAILLQIPAGEFIIFEEENTMLWPIRIEDLRKITEL